MILAWRISRFRRGLLDDNRRLRRGRRRSISSVVGVVGRVFLWLRLGGRIFDPLPQFIHFHISIDDGRVQTLAARGEQVKLRARSGLLTFERTTPRIARILRVG